MWKYIQQFFAAVYGIPDNLAQTLKEFASSLFYGKKSVDSNVQKNPNQAKKDALNYDQESGEMKGTASKAAKIVKSLNFLRYDESSTCELKEGIPKEEFDATVGELADLIGLPEKITNTIKRAKVFKGGNIQAVRKMAFKDKDGTLVFGRVAVVRRGDDLDIAYSLHTVQYELAPVQPNQNNAWTFTSFVNNLNNNKVTEKEVHVLSLDQRTDFLAFFHKEAVNGFVKNCKYVLTTATSEASKLARGAAENEEMVKE